MSNPPMLLNFSEIFPLLVRADPGKPSFNFQWDLFQWNISTYEKTDIVWSIILSYLNSFNISNRTELISHIQSITDRRAVPNLLQERVVKYNPFLYRGTCVYDDEISTLVSDFKKRIDEYCDIHMTAYRNYPPNFIAAEASSILLKCNIIVVVLNQNPMLILETYPTMFKEYYENQIIIYSSREANNELESFTFNVPLEIGLEKQRFAFKEIIKKTSIKTKKVNVITTEICNSEDLHKNLPICLLASPSICDCIPEIYKSPYILSKLEDAAFVTDPRQNDATGKSALYYALISDKPSLLYFLYDHAANNCFYSSQTVRSPDSLIVENLILLKKYLQYVRFCLQRNESEGHLSFLPRLDELCRYNDFQNELCHDIHKARQENNYYQDNRLEDICRIKTIVLVILKVYQKYFMYENNFAHCSKLGSLKEFDQHIDYFDNLDFCAAIMFFDNLYLLKEKLELPKNSYKKIESRFFLFIYCRKFFEKFIGEENNILTKAIIFQERLKLEKRLEVFKNLLQERKITDETVRERISSDSVLTLTDLPEIYGDLLLTRLKYYLDTAINLTNMKSEKAGLVIQRTLQVVGECLKELNFRTTQKIIPLSLPSDIVTDLKQIRNQLSSRSEPSVLPYRIFVENDIDLFISIQSELAFLQKILTPIYSTQMYTKNHFFLLATLKAIKETSKDYVPNIEDRSLSAQTVSEQGDVTNRNFENQWEESGRNTFTLIKKKIAQINRNQNILSSERNIYYKHVIVNSFEQIHRKLNETAEDIKSKRCTLEKFDTLCGHFWAVEQLLSYIVKDKNVALYRRMVLKKIKYRESITFFVLKSTNPQDSFTNIELLEKLENILCEYKRIFNAILKHVHCSDDADLDVTFPNIHKFRKIVKGFTFITAQQKKEILQSIPKNFQDIHLSRIKVLKYLENKGKITKQEAETELNKLFPDQDEKLERLRGHFKPGDHEFLEFIRSIEDLYSELEDAIDENEISKANFEKLCKKLHITEESILTIIRKIVQGQKEKLQENHLILIRHRIQKLKNILIGSNNEIAELYNAPKSERKRLYMHEKIINNFLRDPEVRCSVEMLLFDCMNLLNTNRDLQVLCRKTSNLFNGINLRNVLAHGNPLLESSCRLLDPYDLPSELIKKSLKLIDDLDIIECMLRILDEQDQSFSTFHAIINDDDSVEFQAEKELIMKCEDWKAYAKLLPDQRNHTNGVLSNNNGLETISTTTTTS